MGDILKHPSATGTVLIKGGMDLTLRQRSILKAIIDSYIKLGRPVSSKELKDRDNFPYSTATLRNEMSFLEKAGFLTHEHTSSGRVPTDKGYRYYVNEITALQKLATHTIENLSYEYMRKYSELSRLMLETSTILSSLSSFVGFAVTPRLNELKVKRIELVRLDSMTCAVLLVTESNVIKHKLIKTSVPFSEEQVRMLSAVVNEKLSGLPLSTAKKGLKDIFSPTNLREYERFFQVFDDCIGNFCDDDDIFLEGTSKVLRYCAGRENTIEEILDDKSRLSQIIEKDLLEEGLRIWIGDEINSLAFRDFSIIRSTFALSGRQVGLIGIIGPKRMEYNKMADIVVSISESLSKTLCTAEEQKNEE